MVRTTPDGLPLTEADYPSTLVWCTSMTAGYPSEEPIAGKPHDGICGGESQQWLSYPTKSIFTLIAADDPDAFTADTPTARLVRQILGAVSEFEKAALVARLKGARDRRSAALGRRCEGRRSHIEARP